MKIEHIEVYGFAAALRGMRNPMNSWAKADTVFGELCVHPMVHSAERPLIGPNDMQLMLSLIRSGGSHRKFLRMISVWWDITIPRAIWQELDTYKVSTVRNSCSTMHKLGQRDLDAEDFEGGKIDSGQLLMVNRLAAEHRTTKSPQTLHDLKMALPEGFLQKATFSFNYEVALRMYYDRSNHRMPEWSGPNGICEHILALPYMQAIVEAAR